MTLLEAYIKKMNHDFHEPERKGTPKGHEIGMFRGRLNAAMYSMYNCELKEVASRAGITYAFLRKLRSEKPFQELVKEQRSEFVDEFVMGYFNNGLAYTVSPEATIDNPKVDEFELSPETAFRDAAEYSFELKKDIADFIIYQIEHDGIQTIQTDGRDFQLTNSGLKDIEENMDRLFFLMSKWNEPELNKVIFKTLMKYGEELICNTIGKVDASAEMRIRATNFTHLITMLSTTL